MSVIGNELKQILAGYGVTLVTRAEWGARPPKAVNLMLLPTARLYVHHTADDRQGESIDNHQNYHMDTRGWNDLAYNLMVEDNGTAYEGRGVGVVGGATGGENTTSHAICLFGNFMGRQPTAASLNTVVAIARCGRDRGWWVPTLHGHRDAPGSSTSCPGDFLYAQLPTLRTRVAQTTTEDDAMTPAQLVEIKTTIREDVQRLAQYLALGQGNTAFPQTEGSPWKNGTTNPKLLAAIGQVTDVDEAAIAQAILAGLNPTQIAETIAAAVGPELAEDVANELHARLAG